jgi:hypothetical protein
VKTAKARAQPDVEPAPEAATDAATPVPARPAPEREEPAPAAAAAPIETAPDTAAAAAPIETAPDTAAAAVPVETAPAKASSPPAGDGLAALLAAWPDVVARLSADPPTKPLILACRPVAVDGAIVTLGFPEEQSFLKDAIERRRAKIEAGIGESLGHEVTVRCVVANIEVAPPPEPTSDGALVMAEANRIFADVLVDVAEVD